MSAARLMTLGAGLVLLLIVGSCAAIGFTTVATVDGLANSDAATRANRKLNELELKVHNEIGNRDGSYHEYSDYERDYYENY